MKDLFFYLATCDRPECRSAVTCTTTSLGGIPRGWVVAEATNQLFCTEACLRRWLGESARIRWEPKRADIVMLEYA